MDEHERHRHHPHSEECCRGDEHQQECGCKEHHSGHGEHHCCHGEGMHGMGWHRRFPTREERIAELEEYLKALRAEAQGVEEHICELKAAK